jgi:HAMP domain-containing protein
MDILTEWMTVFWLKPFVNNIENIRNNLSTKDFSTFSNANILKEINATKNSVQKEFFNAITNYSYRHGDLVNMEV